MKIAMMRGFVCGHFEKDRCELEIENKLELYMQNPGYCERCNDFVKVKRVNIFVVEQDIPEIV